MKNTRNLLGAVAVVLTAFVVNVKGADVQWIGNAGDRLWSSAGNWNGGLVPTAADNALFSLADNSGSQGPGGYANHLVDQDFSALSLRWTNVAGFHHTYINPGVKLTLGASLSAAGNALMVGTTPDAGANNSVYATISGAGELVVTNPAYATVYASVKSGSSGTHRGTLDLSGLDTFTAYIQRIAIAADGVGAPNNYPCGTLLLAKTNYIECNNATNSLWVGEATTNPGQTCYVRLGQTNVFFGNGGIVVGGRKSTAVIDFNTGLVNPVAVFRNKAGTGPMNYWGIGDAVTQTGNTTVNHAGTADFTAGTVDAMVGTLYVARGIRAASAATTTGTLLFNSGKIAATTIEIGYQDTAGTNRAIGTVSMGPLV